MPGMDGAHRGVPPGESSPKANEMERAMDAYRSVAEFAELTSIGITPKKVVRIKDGRGMRLRVEAGAVWITEGGSLDDVFLTAGESYSIQRDGITLISTIKVPFAMVTIEPAMRVAPTIAERFSEFWAGLYAPESCPTTAAL